MNKLQYLTLALALIAIAAGIVLEVQFHQFRLQVEQFAVMQAKLNASQEKLNTVEAQRSLAQAKLNAAETKQSLMQAKLNAVELQSNRSELLFEAIVSRRLGLMHPIVPTPAPRTY